MPTHVYTVEIDGHEYDLEGDHEPSEAEARAAIGATAPPAPKKATPPPASATIGMLQPSTATTSDQVPSVFGFPMKPDLAQMTDGVEVMGQPIGPLPTTGAISAAKAVPGILARAAGISKARAGANIAAAEQAAQGVAVGTEGVGQAGLRAMELQQSGGRMPRAVSQLMQRITDPKLPEMTFEEARDFYSNISRLSANEFGSLNPVMQRQVGVMKQALHEALTAAAGTVGKGEQYAQGISEYAKAGRAAATWENKIKPMLGMALKRAAQGTGLYGGYEMTKRALD